MVDYKIQYGDNTLGQCFQDGLNENLNGEIENRNHILSNKIDKRESSEISEILALYLKSNKRFTSDFFSLLCYYLDHYRMRFCYLVTYTIYGTYLLFI